MNFTPFMLDLQNKNIVVIGGGAVAERRVNKLLSSGAKITVISPSVTAGMKTLSKNGSIFWYEKEYEQDDITEAFLVIIATNNPVVNNEILQHLPNHVLVNNATNGELGNVYFPTTIERGKLSISITTNGASPILAKKIKSQLEAQFDCDFGHYVDFIYECRQLIKKSSLPKEKQKQLLKDIVENDWQDKKQQQQLIDWLHTI